MWVLNNDYSFFGLPFKKLKLIFFISFKVRKKKNIRKIMKCIFSFTVSMKNNYEIGRLID